MPVWTITANDPPRAALAAMRLMTARDIARLFKVSTQRTAEVMRRPEFPAPAGTIARSRVWFGSDVDAFLAGWDRRPGRKPARKP